VDTLALKYALKSGKVKEAIVDCWENEPEIDPELVESAYIATPHIAGYSMDGKANGTLMSVQAIDRFFNIGINLNQLPCTSGNLMNEITIENNSYSHEEIIHKVVSSTYNIFLDHQRLRKSIQTFEKQRDSYPERREFFAYSLKNIEKEYQQIFKSLGFQVLSE
jgi:erythronate-4-phosphate dehydrogenase